MARFLLHELYYFGMRPMRHISISTREKNTIPEGEPVGGSNVITGYILAVLNNPERLLQEYRPPPKTLLIVRPSIREAMEVASRVTPSLVLTEHHLLDGQGLDLILALGNHPGLEDVPIILLGVDDLHYYQWLGISGYLPARARPGQLNHVLEEVLAGHRSRQLVSA